MLQMFRPICHRIYGLIYVQISGYDCRLLPMISTATYGMQTKSQNIREKEGLRMWVMNNIKRLIGRETFQFFRIRVKCNFSYFRSQWELEENS